MALMSSLSSLACLASSCFIALHLCTHTHCLSRLACLAAGCSTFGVELHGEDSSVAFSRSISVELVDGFHCVLTCTELKSFSTCANLKSMCTFISIRLIKIFGIWPYGPKQVTNQHTHVSCNAVTLVCC